MIPFGTRYIGGLGTATAIRDGSGNVVLDFSSTNVRVVVAGGSLTALGTAAFLNTASTLIPAAQGVKVVANGTLLAAATPDFAGQLMVALDGGVGIARTASPGHHTDTIVWQGGMVAAFMRNPSGVTGFTADGNFTGGSNGQENYFVINDAGYVDNVGRLENNSGGFHAWRYTEAGDEIGATGCAPKSNGAKWYAEAGKSVGSSAIDVPAMGLRHYCVYSTVQYAYTQLYIDASGGVTLYGLDSTKVDSAFLTPHSSAPVGVYVNADGRVGIGTQSVQSGCALTIPGKTQMGSAPGTVALAFVGPPQLSSISAAMPPDPTTCEGCIAYCSDESGGKTLAFCDGVAWRRAQDRAVVS